MSLYKDLVEKKATLAVVGLGYVGMPIAVAFAKYVNVIGFDVNEDKVIQYQNGMDPTCEVGNEAISRSSVRFTSEEHRLKESKFYIVAVPTPVNQDKTPDLTPVEKASELIGRNLTKGSVVVYESTVYPGVTEEICVPILERCSGLKFGEDFKVGYSPERINPGDRVHRLETIKKIVSGSDLEALDTISSVYSLVIEAGVHRVSSLKAAEAAKVVENSQRDINIAFMNELAMVFDRMGIDTKEVVEAMNTKWNALGFYPGLVGGHCIGVDPYYFVYKAENLGYHSQIIAAGRKVNDSMGTFVADALIKELVLSGKIVKEAKVAVFGMTFKEDCPDTRNSKVIDIITRLQEYGIRPLVTDAWAESEQTSQEYGIELKKQGEIRDADCILFAVAHTEYRALTVDTLDCFFRQGEPEDKILIDVKSIFSKEEVLRKGYRYWRL